MAGVHLASPENHYPIYSGRTHHIHTYINGADVFGNASDVEFSTVARNGETREESEGFLIGGGGPSGLGFWQRAREGFSL